MYHIYVVHKTPTRLRIKLKDGRIPQSLISIIEAHLSSLPGVESVRVNPLTSSILLQGSNLQIDDVLNTLSNSFPVKVESPKPLHPVQRAVQPFIDLDQTLRKITGGEVGLAEAGFLVLLSIGALQILRGNITAPPWYTAFWYAFGVFSRELVARYGCKEVRASTGETVSSTPDIASEPSKVQETELEKKKEEHQEEEAVKSQLELS